MADGNWWESSSSSSSSRNRFDSASSPSSTAMNNSSSTLVGGGSFGWSTTHDLLEDNTTKPLTESANSLSNLHQPDHHHHHHSNLQIMGLALSSQPMDWNHNLLRSEKAERSFRNLIQDDVNANASFQLDSGISSSQDHWNSRHNIYSGSSNDDSSEFSTVTCQGLPTNYDYATSNPSILQGLMGSDHHHQSINYPHNQADYTLTSASDHHHHQPWSNKMVPQFLGGSPPKQLPPQPHGQLNFSNNAPYWNAASDASNISDVRSGFFPSLQMQSPNYSNFEDKSPKVEVRDTTAVKKSNSESSSKRSRNEATMPPFKARKEKMGDRVTALQQLVSPFGKTDTASVLSEAIDYIKFLHEQVSVLSSPYMKSGAPPHQHKQVVNYDEAEEKVSKDPGSGAKQDLRSRGLCVVPLSSTYPVTDETTFDFWTPTFGGTFR